MATDWRAKQNSDGTVSWLTLEISSPRFFTNAEKIAGAKNKGKTSAFLFGKGGKRYKK